MKNPPRFRQIRVELPYFTNQIFKDFNFKEWVIKEALLLINNPLAIKEDPYREKRDNIGKYKNQLIEKIKNEDFYLDCASDNEQTWNEIVVICEEVD